MSLDSQKTNDEFASYGKFTDELEAMGFKMDLHINPTGKHGQSRHTFRGKDLIIDLTYFPASEKWLLSINSSNFDQKVHFVTRNAIPIEDALGKVQAYLKKRGIE